MSVIVTAEDDPDLAELFTGALIRAGHIVHHATTGPQALRLIAIYQPHLVVLDEHMPGMTGLGVARLLRDESTTASLSMIMVSAVTPSAAYQLFDEVLTKPISSRALIRTAAHLLEPPAARLANP